MKTYECDNCGACCEVFVAFATHVDALREPKVLNADVSRNRIPLTLLEWGHNVHLSYGEGAPCKFLNKHKKCDIYKTRPTRCVEFEVGGEGCQEARAKIGLKPLQPKN